MNHPRNVILREMVVVSISCIVSWFAMQVLQHLLELGADISLRTKHGWTGVHICAIRGSTVCLQVCEVVSALRI